jgi:MFS family permease
MTYDPYDISNRDAEINEILQRPQTVNIGQYLNRATDLFGRKAGELIGFTFLYFIITIAVQQIPYIGPLIGGLIASVILAGFYFFSFKLMRGQEPEFGDFFLGFKNNHLWPIVLVNLFIGLLVGFISLLSFAFIVLGFYRPLANLLDRFREQSPAAASEIPALPELPIPEGITTIFLVLGLLLLIPVTYLSVCYIFAPLLVIDRRLGAWQAMETSRKLVNKNWFLWWVFTILQGLIVVGGICACYIGVIFAMPVVACSTAAAYEHIVGLSQRNSLPEEGGFP